MRRFLTVIAIGVVLACSGAASGQSGPGATYLFTSDIHLNPMADPKLVDRLAAAPVAQWDAIFAADPQPPAPFGQDTNATLFRLSLAQMKKTIPEPAVVIISGDFLAHNYRAQWNAAASTYSTPAFDAFVDKTIAYLAFEFDAAFPHAQFVITLGNNDSACGDYAETPHGPFLAHFATAWEPLVDRGGRAPDFAHDFAAFGNYTATLPNRTRVIALNSNLFSPSVVTSCDPEGDARSETIAWYERMVAAAPSGAKTWVVEHVPPGIDAYSWLQKSAVPTFYATDLLARFRDVRAADGKPVGLIVAAHLHNGGYRIVDETPLLLVPSISPLHANDPAFFVARVNDATGAIADYDAYALNLPMASATSAFAHEYAFNQAYGVHGFTLRSLQTIQQNIRDDAGGIRETESDYWVAGSPFKAITPATWKTYWCSNGNLDVGAFSACLSR